MTNRPGWSDVYAGITTAIGVATALLTAVGVTTGFALRMLRNDFWWFGLGLLLMVAGMVGTIHYFKAQNNGWTKSIVVFFVGVLVLIYVAHTASQARERPHIAVSSETMASGLVKVTTTVKAEGLQTEDLIYVIARGRMRVPVDPSTEKPVDATISRWEIHQSAFGPKADGSVEATSTFEVSPARYRDVVIMASRHRTEVGADSPCIPLSSQVSATPAPVPNATEESAQGCVRFLVPLAPRRPVVSASITAASSGSTLRTFTANVSAGGVPASKLVIIKAWWLPVRGQHETLMNQALGPDLGGNIKTSITVPLAKGAGDACVVAAHPPSDIEVPQVERGLCKEGAALPHFMGVAVVRANEAARNLLTRLVRR